MIQLHYRRLLGLGSLITNIIVREYAAPDNETQVSIRLELRPAVKPVIQIYCDELPREV
jgi:hypothetical protein